MGTWPNRSSEGVRASINNNNLTRVSRATMLNITNNTANTGHSTQPGNSGNNNTLPGNNINNRQELVQEVQEINLSLLLLLHLKNLTSQQIPTICSKAPLHNWWSTPGRWTSKRKITSGWRPTLSSGPASRSPPGGPSQARSKLHKYIRGLEAFIRNLNLTLY